MDNSGKINETQVLKDKCIVIRIQEESICIRGSLYEAVRRCWRANIDRARKANYILAVIGNDTKVKGVIKIEYCYCPDDAFCAKNMEECQKRYGVEIELCKKNRRIAFMGREILDNHKYLNKDIPVKYIPKQNPIRYCYR